MATIDLEYEVWTVTFNRGHKARYRDYERAKAAVDKSERAVLTGPETVRRPAR